ncbi:hypothetical protein TanjilG_25605 [Lupinus angustifolius]|uniref:Uncharacterized protein n=1 Tax=Lupinus angustifolius TaxID=3871 RepID=A0A4P1QTY9_LUPAN|nr:hypothetical protein TanjilG_25605 [Lupinus angustifolius]
MGFPILTIPKVLVRKGSIEWLQRRRHNARFSGFPSRFLQKIFSPTMREYVEGARVVALC